VTADNTKDREGPVNLDFRLNEHAADVPARPWPSRPGASSAS
jgi:hypothetical protein